MFIYFTCNISGKDLEETPIIIADVANEESLAEMCKQAKVVLNCVGPVSMCCYISEKHSTTSFYRPA